MKTDLHVDIQIIGVVRPGGRKLIKSGGLYLNNHRVESAEERLDSTAAIEGQVCVVRTGKKKYFLVKFTE